MQPLSGNQRPDLLTALMNISLLLRLPRKMPLCRSSSNIPRLPSFLETATKPSRFARLPRTTTSERPKVFRNVLRATTACTFSTPQLPKEVRSWGVLFIFSWTCASRHNGAQLFISHLITWLRARRFSEPTFWPSGATDHWGNTMCRDFPIFSRAWIFFLRRLSPFDLLSSSLLFSSLTLPISAFHPVHIVRRVWLLNFLR